MPGCATSTAQVPDNTAMRRGTDGTGADNPGPTLCV